MARAARERGLLGQLRMMLAMFTQPGESSDSLASEIEFREGGQIFANGQQIK